MMQRDQFVVHNKTPWESYESDTPSVAPHPDSLASVLI